MGLLQPWLHPTGKSTTGFTPSTPIANLCSGEGHGWATPRVAEIKDSLQPRLGTYLHRRFHSQGGILNISDTPLCCCLSRASSPWHFRGRSAILTMPPPPCSYTTGVRALNFYASRAPQRINLIACKSNSLAFIYNLLPTTHQFSLNYL